MTTMFEQVGFQKGDKTPTLIIISISLEILIASNLYPWSAPQLMALSALTTGTGIVVSNAKYLVFILLLSVLLMSFCLLLMRLFRCDIKKMAQADLSFLEEKYKDGLSVYQRSVLIFMLIYVIGMISISFFPKSLGTITTLVTTSVSLIGWSVLMAGLMMFIKVDGKSLLEPKSMATFFPWDLLFMIGAGIYIGTALTSAESGVTAWVGLALGPILGGVNEVVMYVIICLVSLLLTNVLNNNAVIILMSTAVVTLTTQGFITEPIVPIILTIISGNMGFVTPAASIYGAMIHGHGYVTAASGYKWGVIMMLCIFVFLLAATIPLGSLMF